MFLKISNPGVTDIRFFLLLGASESRDNEAAIGQFGHGSKAAALLLMRQGIPPIIYSGLNRLQYFTEPEQVGSKTFNRVGYQIRGKDQNGKSFTRTERTTMTLEYGTTDWTDTSMALREYVSNALDGSLAKGDIRAAQVEVVSEARAKDGETRVFIPLTPEVQRFSAELGHRFLHFSEPESLSKKILPKTNRTLDPKNQAAMIYKKGVFVRQVSSDLPSLFDYNLGDELTLDECRNVSDYVVQGAVAQALKNADSKTLGYLLNKLTTEACWESSLSWWLTSDSDSASKERAKIWKSAFESNFESNTVFASNGLLSDMAARKGFAVKVLPSSWLDAAKSYGLPTEHKIFNNEERKGITLCDPTPAVTQAVAEIWDFLEAYGLTNGKAKPTKLHCFSSIMEAGVEVRGFCRLHDQVIGINQAIAGAKTEDLMQTTLEEVAHYVTGAMDNSRDFQDYAFRLAARLMT